MLGHWPHAFSPEDRAWTSTPRGDRTPAGKLIAWVQSVCGWVLDIVKRSDPAKGWVLLPRRWVVERTFGWLSRCRALARDYEFHPETSEALIQIAMIHVMLRRLAKGGRAVACYC